MDPFTPSTFFPGASVPFLCVRTHATPTTTPLPYVERVNCVATGVHGLDNTGSARYIELRLLVHYGVGGRGICTPAFPLLLSLPPLSLSLSVSVCVSATSSSIPFGTGQEAQEDQNELPINQQSETIWLARSYLARREL